MKTTTYKKPMMELVPLEAWAEFMDVTSFGGVGLENATEEELVF